MNSDLAKEVAKRVKNANQNTSTLRELWKFYGEMHIEGQLPSIPDSWIDDLPEVGPRLISNYVSTIYSHAFIMQPKRRARARALLPVIIEQGIPISLHLLTISLDNSKEDTRIATLFPALLHISKINNAIMLLPAPVGSSIATRWSSSISS